MARIELVVALVVLVLEVYAIVNCILTPEDQVKGVPKVLWLVLIVLLPLLGSVLWLGVGRERVGAAPPRRPVASPPAVSPSGYAAMTAEERIRRMEEDLARLEREAGDDGAGPHG